MSSSSSCYANVIQFSFGGIQNEVFNTVAGYYNYTHLEAEVAAGQTRWLTISFDRKNITTDDVIAGAVYIDWNADGDFDDSEELLFMDKGIIGNGVFSFPVYIPDEVIPATTRIRTRAEEYEWPELGPCGYADETQDYTVRIISGVSLATPGSFSAIPHGKAAIRLTWDDLSSGEDSYIIERSTDGIQFEVVCETGGNTAEYLDQDLDQGKKYYYRATAREGIDHSAYSEVVSATTLPVVFEKNLTEDIKQYNWFSTGVFWADYDGDELPEAYIGKDNMFYSWNGEDFIIEEAGFESSQQASWIDYNNDGKMDLFILDMGADWKDPKNMLYENEGGGLFSPHILLDSRDRIVSNAWADVNRDGLLDVYLSIMETYDGIIYLNTGDTTFIEYLVSDEVQGYSSFADYDGDGDPDLFVCQWGKNKLFNNNGEGLFTEQPDHLLCQWSSMSNGASWGDVDNDGDLDLFITNGAHDSENNSLYMNQGEGVFTKTTQGAVVNDGGESLGSAFSDIDNDGNLDLVVANWGADNFLYAGNGDGTFRRLEQSRVDNDTITGYPLSISSKGCAFADYNNDGFQDLLVANSGGNFNSLFTNQGNKNHWLKVRLTGTESNAAAIGAKVWLYCDERVQFRELSPQSGLQSQNDLVQSFGLGSNTRVDSVVIWWPSGNTHIVSNPGIDKTLTVVEGSTTEISDREFQCSIKVYPNPVSDLLNIEWPGNQLADLLIKDLAGKTVKSCGYVGSGYRMDTGSLKDGFYILQLRTRGVSVSQRVLICH